MDLFHSAALGGRQFSKRSPMHPMVSYQMYTGKIAFAQGKSEDHLFPLGLLENAKIPLCLRDGDKDVWQWPEHVVKKPVCSTAGSNG